MSVANGILLDTCAIIWLVTKSKMLPSAVTIIDAAGARGRVFVSPISGWEVGMLSQRQVRSSNDPVFEPDAETWFSTFLAFSAVSLATLDVDVAMAGGLLPPAIHGDPCDRLLMATARHLDIPIVTRDRKIIAYGEAGHVEVIEC